MAKNPIIRTMEIVLFGGLLLHILDGLRLWMDNKKKRPIAYAVVDGAANSKWYSRSMGLLGTLLLIFLIVHFANFWVVSRFTGIENFKGIAPKDANGHENLYAVMQETFKNLGLVILYVLSMISLAYHLLHGFASAFQTLGWNHRKYTPVIKAIGVWFSILIPLIFAAMPVWIYLGLNK